MVGNGDMEIAGRIDKVEKSEYNPFHFAIPLHQTTPGHRNHEGHEGHRVWQPLASCFPGILGIGNLHIHTVSTQVAKHVYQGDQGSGVAS
jgi:hypothetical protein